MVAAASPARTQRSGQSASLCPCPFLLARGACGSGPTHSIRQQCHVLLPSPREPAKLPKQPALEPQPNPSTSSRSLHQAPPPCKWSCGRHGHTLFLSQTCQRAPVNKLHNERRGQGLTVHPPVSLSHWPGRQSATASGHHWWDWALLHGSACSGLMMGCKTLEVSSAVRVRCKETAVSQWRPPRQGLLGRLSIGFIVYLDVVIVAVSWFTFVGYGHLVDPHQPPSCSIRASRRSTGSPLRLSGGRAEVEGGSGKAESGQGRRATFGNNFGEHGRIDSIGCSVSFKNK